MLVPPTFGVRVVLDVNGVQSFGYSPLATGSNSMTVGALVEFVGCSFELIDATWIDCYHGRLGISKGVGNR